MSTIIAFSGIHSETVILDCTQFHGCLCKANSCIFKCSPKVFYSLKPTPPHRNSKGTHYYIFIRVIIIIYIVKLRKGLRGQVMVWSWKLGWFALCQISILWPITFCLKFDSIVFRACPIKFDNKSPDLLLQDQYFMKTMVNVWASTVQSIPLVKSQTAFTNKAQRSCLLQKNLKCFILVPYTWYCGYIANQVWFGTTVFIQFEIQF